MRTPETFSRLFSAILPLTTPLPPLGAEGGWAVAYLTSITETTDSMRLATLLKEPKSLSAFKSLRRNCD